MNKQAATAANPTQDDASVAKVTTLPPLGECQVRAIPIAQINLDESRFDYRVEPEDESLEASLTVHGQQVPVILWGDEAPYEIINGHRRVRALKALGVEVVMAIVRDNIESEEQANVLAFLDDHQHLALDPVDRVAIVKRFEADGKSDSYIKTALAIGDTILREIRRFDRMPDYLKDQVRNGVINWMHAQTLNSYSKKMPLDYAEWVAKAKDGLSARQMKTEIKELAKAHKANATPEPLKTRKKGSGFSLSIKVTSKTSAEDLARYQEALDEAQAMMQAHEAQAGSEGGDGSTDSGSN
jgi:ParB/RepB/Spo0J family partition protein